MVDNNPPYNKRNIGTRYENIAVEYLLLKEIIEPDLVK